MNKYMDETGLAALGPLDSDDIPLRQALATFLHENPNEGGRIITDFINDEGEKYQKLESKNFTKSLTFIVAAIFLSIVSQGISKIYPLVSLIMFLLALLFLGLCFVPRLRMQSFQYGNNPKEALALPHTAHEEIDKFLAPLQDEFEAKAYYYSVWRKKRIALDYKQFFSKLRYLLFSEHRHIRSLVLRYPTAIRSPQGLFIRRSDLDMMVAANAPKRKGGPGRTPSPRYADALIALLGDQNLLRIDTRDAESATKQIRKILMDWFKANKDDTEWEPKTNQIETYVEKIYARLKNLAASR